MPGPWRLVLLGGDGREVEAAACLAHAGHTVSAYGQRGRPVPAEALAAMREAEAIIGPSRGTNAAGDALQTDAAPLPVAEAWLEAGAGRPWVVGGAGPWLRARAAAWGSRVTTYADRDEFATLNAVPTAEGTIAEAGRLAGRTVWGEEALVVGGGRCALALVPRLAALGCRVTLAARNPAERARAAALGAAQTTGLAGIAGLAAGCTFVFNTVPAPLLDRAVLAALPRDAVVADIASAPGGTDFAAAEALGVRAALLPALPGRLYPKTAGRIVAAVVQGILDRLAEGGDGDARI